MKKWNMFILVPVICIVSMVSCQLSEELAVDFNIIETSGYSRAIFEDNKMENGSSSLNFFVSIHNQTDQEATLTGWTFRILHNIVPLCEISDTDYQTYKLEVNSSTVLAASQILDLYVNTRRPYEDNRVSNKKLGFDAYTPDTLIVELEITDSEGRVHTISAKGAYQYETEIDDD